MYLDFNFSERIQTKSIGLFNMFNSCKCYFVRTANVLRQTLHLNLGLYALYFVIIRLINDHAKAVPLSAPLFYVCLMCISTSWCKVEDMCMSVLCFRDRCMFCVSFPAWDFSDLLVDDIMILLSLVQLSIDILFGLSGSCDVILWIQKRNTAYTGVRGRWYCCSFY